MEQTLTVNGIFVPPGPARHLVLAGFDTIVWPDSFPNHILDGSYMAQAENYYEIGNANGHIYIRFLFSY